MDMGESNIKQFAITARSEGRPRKLYTPIMVFNLEKVQAARMNAMWDTGAEYCLISLAMAQELGLEFDAKIRTKGLTGVSVATVGYTYVSLVAGGGIVDVETAVVDGHVGGDEYSFIIGLNLISKGTLTLTYAEDCTVLSFKVPSDRAVDYVAESDESMPKAYVPLSCGKEKADVWRERAALQLMLDSCSPEKLRDTLKRRGAY